MSSYVTLTKPIRWPRTLFSRLTFILLLGLVLAHALSFALVFYERSTSSTTMMMAYLAQDIASGVAILERVPAVERGSWIDRLERKNYRYRLGPQPLGAAAHSEFIERVRHSVADALGPTYSVRATLATGQTSTAYLSLYLNDGTSLNIELSLAVMPLAPWVLFVLGVQLILLIMASLLAVKLVTRPLAQLARAADSLGADLKASILDESGPLEVSQAAAAFNAMQRRIAASLSERMRLLAAISHDLQTPITRMHLRADLLDDVILRDKFNADLHAMQTLVQEGIAYARDAQGVSETICRTDLNALLESIVYDYADAGKQVRLTGRADRALATRPHTLKRIIGNLLDNALKFAVDAELVIAQLPDHVNIEVCDHGPGIPDTELNAVMQPFYRLEHSRNRDTGGTGLGLAIAQQLTIALGGTLSLSNREHGGLRACVRLPSNS